MLGGHHTVAWGNDAPVGFMKLSVSAAFEMLATRAMKLPLQCAVSAPIRPDT